jgi:hypothetical protein
LTKGHDHELQAAKELDEIYEKNQSSVNEKLIKLKEIGYKDETIGKYLLRAKIQNEGKYFNERKIDKNESFTKVNAPPVEGLTKDYQEGLVNKPFDGKDEMQDQNLGHDEFSTFLKIKGKTSKYIGVHYATSSLPHPWLAQLSIDGKKFSFGRFKTDREAGKRINKICDQNYWTRKNEISSDEETVDILPVKRNMKGTYKVIENVEATSGFDLKSSMVTKLYEKGEIVNVLHTRLIDGIIRGQLDATCEWISIASISGHKWWLKKK